MYIIVKKKHFGWFWFSLSQSQMETNYAFLLKWPSIHLTCIHTTNWLMGVKSANSNGIKVKQSLKYVKIEIGFVFWDFGITYRELINLNSNRDAEVIDFLLWSLGWACLPFCHSLLCFCLKKNGTRGDHYVNLM